MSHSYSYNTIVNIFMPMFPSLSLSTSQKRLWRTCNISSKMPNLSTTSIKFKKDKMQATMPSPSKRKILMQFRNSNAPIAATDSILDDFNGGSLVQDGLVYRQAIVVRSFEIGGDGHISLGGLTNYLQDTALNHLRRTGISADGFGSTPKMIRNDLIWIVYTMHLIVNRYPLWGDVIVVDTWIHSGGKRIVGRDWLVRDGKTGETLCRASSVYMIMNKKTRKASRITKEIREEFSPFMMDSDPTVSKDSKKLSKLDVNTAEYASTGLKPLWSDMDINQHVSHVKYIDWILESIPYSFMKDHEAFALSIEYRKECNRNNVVHSLSNMVKNNENDKSSDKDAVEFSHLLVDQDGSVILKGRTTWKPKGAKNSNNNQVQF